MLNVSMLFYFVGASLSFDCRVLNDNKGVDLPRSAMAMPSFASADQAVQILRAQHPLVRVKVSKRKLRFGFAPGSCLRREKPRSILDKNLWLGDCGTITPVSKESLCLTGKDVLREIASDRIPER